MASSKIMMNKHTKLIGVALYRFKLEIDDYECIIPSCGLAMVHWRKCEDTFVLIPEIWFSPRLNKWDAKQLAFVMIHEILHTLDRHQTRMGSRDPIIWNLACDHVINRRIKQDVDRSGSTIGNAVRLPDKIEHNGKQVEQMFLIEDLMNKDLIVEEIYDKLFSEYEKNKITVSAGKDADGKPNGKIEVDYKGKKYEIDADTIISEGESKEDGKSKSKEVEEIKTIIRGALESDVFKSQNKGDQSGGIIEYLNDIVEVKIPWHMLLEKAIHKFMPVQSDNRSWRVINKRMRSHGFMLPHNDTDDSIESNLYIVSDNSGSISTDDLKKFASIIANAVGFFKTVIIFKHDVAVKSITTIDEMSSEDDIREAIKGEGRGGTSHIPVFDEIERRINDEYDPDEVGMIMILTDYESNIEEIWNNYKWVEEIPVKVILTENHDVAEFVDKEPILIDKVSV